MWQEGEKEGKEADPARQPTVRGQLWGTVGGLTGTAEVVGAGLG